MSYEKIESVMMKKTITNYYIYIYIYVERYLELKLKTKMKKCINS